MEQLKEEEKDGISGETWGCDFLPDETDHVPLEHFVCPQLERIRRCSLL